MKILEELAPDDILNETQEPSPENDELFTKRMRAATKNIHKMSDALVNARLSLAMSDDKVWAEGLLIFYEIFSFLEIYMKKSKLDYFQRMGNILLEFNRKEAFEQDLDFYFGKDFLTSRTYKIRPKVADYLKHLQFLEEREPLRLLAYVYHLYMGLLSGGQILKKKREIKHKVSTLGGLLGSNNPNGNGGDAVTRFDETDGRTISDLKKEIAFTMNDIASDLSEDERASLISESVLVFQHNNEIIRSVENVNKIAIMSLVRHPLFILFVTIFLSFLWCLVRFLFFTPASDLDVEVTDPTASNSTNMGSMDEFLD